MRRSNSLVGAIAVLGLTFLAAPGQAAPAGAVSEHLKAAAGDGRLLEQVRHRCYRHRGHWHCPRHRHYRYYRPGIEFYFGPRHHRRHHRHYRRYWRH